MSESEKFNVIGDALQRMVKDIKHDQDPNYPGDNPENTEQTLSDLEKLGIVKKAEQKKSKTKRTKTKSSKSRSKKSEQTIGVIAGKDSDTGEGITVRAKILRDHTKTSGQVLEEVQEDLHLPEEEQEARYPESFREKEPVPSQDEGVNGNQITSLWNIVNSQTERISEGERLFAANKLARLYQDRLSGQDLGRQARERIQQQHDRVLQWKRQRTENDSKHAVREKTAIRKEEYDNALFQDEKTWKRIRREKQNEWARNNPYEAWPTKAKDLTEREKALERQGNQQTVDFNRGEMERQTSQPQDLGGKRDTQTVPRLEIKGGDILSKKEIEALSGAGRLETTQPIPEKTEEEKLKEMIGQDWEAQARQIFIKDGYSEADIEVLIRTMKPREVEVIFNQIKG